MSFGSSVISFRRAVAVIGSADSMGDHAETVETFAAPGCRHRPLSATETVELGYTVAETRWRSTLPVSTYPADLVARLHTVGAGDTLTVDGIEYRVEVGVQIYPDARGRPFKASLVSRVCDT